MSNLTLNTQLVTFITALVIPFIVGVITKYKAPAFVKFLVNLGVSTAVSVINVSLTAEGTAVISKETLVAAAYTVALSLLVYLGLYKPADTNAKTAPNFGIG